MPRTPLTNTYMYLKENRAYILAGIGTGALAAFALWGVLNTSPAIMQGVTAAARNAGAVFFSGEELHVSHTPEPITAGEPFSVSWQHENGAVQDGSYALQYPCGNGITLSQHNSTDAAAYACGTAHELTTTTTSLSLVAQKTRAATTTVPISIAYMPGGAGTARVQGSTIASVTGPASAQPQDSAPPADTQPPAPADLSVYLIERGTIHQETDVFTATNKVSPDDHVAIRFAVKNRGGGVSAPWSFAAHLPTVDGMKDFTSQEQQVLAPGDRIEFTLGFDAIETDGTPEALIRIRPTGTDKNSSNNILRVPFTIQQ